MKIGLFFGSFNPIHVGHLIIANYFREFTDLEEIWFVVSPQNPFKPPTGLASEEDRLNMVRLAVEGADGYKACDVELTMPRPSYTYRTLEVLTERYPEHEFALIMGGDNIAYFHKWKKFDWIATNFDVYVYPRSGHGTENWEIKRVKLVNAPLLQISATFIRKALAEGRDPYFFVHPRVAEYIKAKGLYR